MGNIPNHRAIINRKKLVSKLAVLVEEKPEGEWRENLLALLKEAYHVGYEEIKNRHFSANRPHGRKTARAGSFLMDQLLRVLFDFTLDNVYPIHNPTKAEQLALVATGGYGRGEMAPFSDVDLLFIIPYKSTPWAENVVEYMLYILWDLGLKVGHATRTPDECCRMAKEDLTIKTALLESRFLWGEEALFIKARRLYLKQVMKGTGPEFVEDKLAERDARHKRLGDARYVVEPNIKDGKGGLRDLQTMWWIVRYLYGTFQRSEMVEQELLSPEEFKGFLKAEEFLWSVRCTLHYLAGRAEERLSFDMQRQLSEQMRYTDHPGSTGVERFMKHYFLMAKHVGDLTYVICSALEDQHKKKPLLDHFRRAKRIGGFKVDNERLLPIELDDFETDPKKMVKIFKVADKHNLAVHPETLRLIKKNLFRINDRVRRDPVANDDFLDILCSTNKPETYLRRMNDAGVFGRFIPDFGRIVAQMQFDMYHHYTVDEHTIRAIGLVSQIEKGNLDQDHPLASKVIKKVVSRHVLYVAVLLHDVAKGRGGDHSILGAEIAKKLCPRLGMSASETETVAWLVRMHLLMSDVAFKRDLADHKTILDFCDQIKSPERLRLLLVLTVVDIRAVGPGVWNGWKGQLLRELYTAAEEVLVAGHVSVGRAQRVEHKKAALAERLKSWTQKDINAYTKRFNDSYWIAEDIDTLEQNASLIHCVDKTNEPLGVAARIESFQDMTVVTVYTDGHPGVFARIVGALGVAGAYIVGAKIHTTTDGKAIDNFMVQSVDGSAFDAEHKLARLEETISETLRGSVKPKERLNKRRYVGPTSESFEVETVALIDNIASNHATLIEVNAKDRQGLLYDLAYALYRLKISIYSAHVATYGERAIDTFYVKDLMGNKITNKVRLRNIEQKMRQAAEGKDIFAVSTKTKAGKKVKKK